jgi:DNA repair protein RadC
MPMIREIILKYKMRRATVEEQENGYLTKLSKPEDAVKSLQDIADEGVERFVCLYLNSKNKILVKQKVEDGTPNMANPILREIFRYALACDASSIIVAHNHPSGDPAPSREDKDYTATLVNAGNALNIKILDHVIISRDLETGEVKHYSFADHSLI